MKAVIDTNVLVYDTFEDSIYHEDAVRLLNRLDKWVIPFIVFYEYVWFLKGVEMSPENTYEKVLEYLEDEKTVIVCETAWEVKWSLTKIVREKLSLSRFNDKVILATAVKRRLPLASFDKQLRNQAVKYGVITLPSSI